MTVPSDNIYLLSISDQRGDDGNMYINNHTRDDGSLAHISRSILDAKVFYDKRDAWNYREDLHMGHWQITPVSAKKLFTKKLKSK